jgi:hypothetical protein
MKKMMIALTALALQSSFAQTVRNFQSPSQWECIYISTGNVCEIYGYGGVNPGTSVTFPSSVYDAGVAKTYTVNQLGDGTDNVFTANNGANTITQINVPSTVYQINPYAFSNLTVCTQINSGSAYIYPNAFPPNLQSATVGGDIGNSAFEGQPKLRCVTLQDGVRSIGSKAFKNCKSLTSLSIPKTVTYIAPDAFEGSGIKYVVLQRGNVSLKSFPKGINATVQQLPYPKR